AMLPTTSWIFASADGKSEQSVPVLSRLSVNTAEAALDAALAGVGPTQGRSYQSAGAVEEGAPRIVLSEVGREPIPVSIIHAGQGLLPLKIRSFLEFAASRLRKSIPTR